MPCSVVVLAMNHDKNETRRSDAGRPSRRWKRRRSPKKRLEAYVQGWLFDRDATDKGTPLSSPGEDYGD